MYHQFRYIDFPLCFIKKIYTGCMMYHILHEKKKSFKLTLQCSHYWLSCEKRKLDMAGSKTSHILNRISGLRLQVPIQKILVLAISFLSPLISFLNHLV